MANDTQAWRQQRPLEAPVVLGTPNNAEAQCAGGESGVAKRNDRE